MLYKPSDNNELYKPCIYIRNKKVGEDCFAEVLFESASKTVTVKFDMLYEQW